MAMIAMTTRMIRAITAIPTGSTPFRADKGRRVSPDGLMLTDNLWAGARLAAWRPGHRARPAPLSWRSSRGPPSDFGRGWREGSLRLPRPCRAGRGSSSSRRCTCGQEIPPQSAPRRCHDLASSGVLADAAVRIHLGCPRVELYTLVQRTLDRPVAGVLATHFDLLDVLHEVREVLEVGPV